MKRVQKINDFLSYISPDPKCPEIGFVRIANSKIRYIAELEGFHNIENGSKVDVVTDEERLIVKIMLNHTSTILLKRECLDDKQVIIYIHEDGIISCENELPEIKVFHCFSTLDDLLAYHINDFVSDSYDEPKYPFHFLVPTDNTLYREPHSISYSEKLKQSILSKLKESNGTNLKRFDIEKSYVEEWNTPTYSLQLHANNHVGNVGFISFLFCKSCIWAIYPYEDDYARVKVIGSAEAQNKFCEFICSFADSGE